MIRRCPGAAVLVRHPCNRAITAAGNSADGTNRTDRPREMIAVKSERHAQHHSWEKRNQKDSQMGVGETGFKSLGTDGDRAPQSTWRFVY
jgi:hypothetical protein